MIRTINNRIILVGVAHVLPESKEEVQRLIFSLKPEYVGVELCYKRYVALSSGNKTDEGPGFEFSRKAILARFLSFLQKKIGEKTGMFPGEEMMTAIDCAQEVDAKVELLDRDIDITLQRLVDRTSFWEKLRILISLVLSSLELEDELNIKDLAKEEFIEKLLDSFKDFSEKAYGILIEERDDYMANRIRKLASNETGTILCVVGAGHIPGITRKLESRSGRESSQNR